MFLQSFEVHLELAPDYACAQGFAKLLRETGTRLLKKHLLLRDIGTRLLKNFYSINSL